MLAKVAKVEADEVTFTLRGRAAVCRLDSVIVVGRPRNALTVVGKGPGMRDITLRVKEGDVVSHDELRRELRKADEVWVRYGTEYGEWVAP